MHSIEEPTPPPTAEPLDELARTLLELAPTSVLLLRPVYAADGEGIVDIAFEYVNPAAQRKILLPAQPTESLRDLFPDDERLLAFYRETYLSGERASYEGSRLVAGLTFVFYLVAQRQGPRLVVSVTSTAEHSADAVAEALHASLAREQAARQLAERQQQDMNRFFEQAPVAISLLRGPQHVVELMNETNATLLGSTPAQLLGRPLMEALPILQGRNLEGVLAQVLRGVTSVFQEVPITSARAHLGQPDLGYYHVTYQPWRATEGEIIGVMVIAVEVTDQVLAHQQLAQLNHELEARVQERTQQAQVAQAEAERQRTRLAQLITEAPAAICVL